MRARLNRRDLRALPVVLGAALLALACGGPADDVVAVVADESVTLDDLERYLDANLAGDEHPDEHGDQADDQADDQAGDEAGDVVKSRLYDALIDERLLVAEARGRGIEVTDAEVEDYLAVTEAGEQVDVDPEAEPAPVGDDRVGSDPAPEARRRLLVEKLQEQVLREVGPPTVDEVRAHLESNRERFDPGARVEMRALAVPSADEAKRIVREIKRRRMTFDEAVVLHREDPGQGAPIAVGEPSLPEPVRAAFAKLKPGGVVGPIDMSGEIYIFQLIGRSAPSTRGVEDQLRIARQDLESRRRRDTYERLLLELRSRYQVRRLTERLPFRYVEDRTDE